MALELPSQTPGGPLVAAVRRVPALREGLRLKSRFCIYRHRHAATGAPLSGEFVKPSVHSPPVETATVPADE